MILRPALLLWLLAVVVTGFGGTIEFNGLLVAGDHTQVSLADTSNGSSAWVAVGGNFSGYAVTSYDAVADEVILTKSGQSEHLHLKDSTMTPAAVIAGKVPNPSLTEVRARTYIMNLDPTLAAAQPAAAAPGPTDAGGGNVAGTESDQVPPPATSGNLTDAGTELAAGDAADGVSSVLSGRPTAAAGSGGNRTATSPGSNPGGTAQNPAAAPRASRGRKG